MSDEFDPYYKWLGIPKEDQPPHAYQLLGVKLFESDTDVISYAADRQMAHLRTFQTSKYAVLSQKILNEIAKAKARLLDPVRKADYDAGLQTYMDAAAPLPPSMPSVPPQASSVPESRVGPNQPATTLNMAEHYARRLSRNDMNPSWPHSWVIASAVIGLIVFVMYLIIASRNSEQVAQQYSGVSKTTEQNDSSHSDTIKRGDNRKGAPVDGGKSESPVPRREIPPDSRSELSPSKDKEEDRQTPLHQEPKSFSSKPDNETKTDPSLSAYELLERLGISPYTGGERGKFPGARPPNIHRGRDDDAQQNAIVNALVEELTKGAESKNRVQAANELARIGPEAAAAVPALIDSMDDVSDEVHAASVYALGKIGPKAKAAIPMLAEVVAKTTSDELRGKAARAIMNIDSKSEAFKKILKKALVGGPGSKPRRSESGVVSANRVWACKIIANMGRDTEWAVPILLDLLSLSGRVLDDNISGVFLSSANALGRIGIKEKGVSAALRSYKTGKGLRAAHAYHIEQAIEACDTALRRIENALEERKEAARKASQEQDKAKRSTSQVKQGSKSKTRISRTAVSKMFYSVESLDDDLIVTIHNSPLGDYKIRIKEPGVYFGERGHRLGGKLTNPFVLVKYSNGTINSVTCDKQQIRRAAKKQEDGKPKNDREGRQ